MNAYKNTFVMFLACILYMPLYANSAWNPFDNKVKKGEGGVDTNVAQTCSESKGTIALNEPEHRYYVRAMFPIHRSC